MSVSSALLATLMLAAGADLQTLSGKKLAGDIVGLDRQTLILRTADGVEMRHPVADLLLIDLGGQPAQPPKGNYYEVELSDGTLLHCSQVVLKGTQAELTLPTDQPVAVPLTAIFTILRDAQDPKLRQEWQKFVSQRGQFDKVAIMTGDRMDGVDVTFGQGTGDGIEFTPAGGSDKRRARLANVAGLIFAQRPDPNAPPPVCKITDAAGNLLVAADVLLNSQGLTVTTVSGVRFAFPDTKRVAKLDFSKGKLTYLSDLDATTLASAEPRLAPVLTGDTDPFKADDAALFRMGRDRNLSNGPLVCGGTTYAKGLALHAGTALKYSLGGDYREMRAILGVDDSVETESKIEIVFEGDGRELYKGATGRKDPPRTLAVDVRGVKELRVTVRAPGLFDTGSQVNLADAKVSK
jgi:hypothetical protein